MALSEIDRNLLSRCLARKPKAWEEFVDRFLGLVIHVINHSAQARSMRLSSEDREDLTADVFLTLVKDDFAVLRHFRGESSLATYLTVVTRRVVVHQLLKKKSQGRLNDGHLPPSHDGRREGTSRDGTSHDGTSHDGNVVERMQNHDEVERLLDGLDGTEARVVRLFHLDGKSYHEISSLVGIPENSVGPMLSRARRKMRRVNDPAVG